MKDRMMNGRDLDTNGINEVRSEEKGVGALDELEKILLWIQVLMYYCIYTVDRF